MISTALVALALVPSLVAETRTAHEQQVRDQSAVTMSLEELGLSVGWSEAHRRLNGCRGEFHHRVVEGSSVTLEGLHAVSWAADSVRIEKLESRRQGSRADSAPMVEEYSPTRVTIQVPLLHDPSPRDEEGRLLLGTLLVPGERLGLVERPGQPPALWLPDRIWGDSTSWLNGAARLTVVRIPASLAGEVIDWVPAESVGIRVLARVAPSSTGCDELWARGAALQ